MNKTKEIPQAFPSISNNGYKEGMTLLDYYAGCVLQGMCACSHDSVAAELPLGKIVEESYKTAELMMKEREKYLGSNDAEK